MRIGVAHSRFAFKGTLSTQDIQKLMPKQNKIRDSVVAIFAHQQRFFIIERQPYLPAFPGYHSFPGGKVDQNDSEEPYTVEYLNAHEPKQMRALCRELQEEINFDLEAAIVQQQVLGFSAFGEAITPAFNQARFHARFYRIDLNTPVDFDAELHEAAWAGWMSAAEFMTHYQQGKLLTAFPALCAMQALAQDPAVKNIGAMHLPYDPETEVPSVQPIHQIVQMPLRSNIPSPTGRTNAFLIGDAPHERFLIDPAPASHEELARLQKVVAQQGLGGIFLTHAPPDRHPFSNELARTFKVPMHMSQTVYETICQQWGTDCFAHIDIRSVKAGDVLTHWLGKAVLVFDIPQGAEGALGLAPASMEWFLVGNLMQGEGTGDSMPKGEAHPYFRTLKKVIELDPQILIPSQGMPVKSTLRLKEVLQDGGFSGG